MSYLLRDSAFDLEQRYDNPVVAEVQRIFGLSHAIGLILVATLLSPLALILSWLGIIFAAIFGARSKTFRSERAAFRAARVRYAIASARIVLPPGMTAEEFAGRPDSHWIAADVPNGGTPYHWVGVASQSTEPTSVKAQT